MSVKGFFSVNGEEPELAIEDGRSWIHLEGSETLK